MSKLFFVITDFPKLVFGKLIFLGNKCLRFSINHVLNMVNRQQYILTVFVFGVIDGGYIKNCSLCMFLFESLCCLTCEFGTATLPQLFVHPLIVLTP